MRREDADYDLGPLVWRGMDGREGEMWNGRILGGNGRDGSGIRVHVWKDKNVLLGFVIEPGNGFVSPSFF